MEFQIMYVLSMDSIVQRQIEKKQHSLFIPFSRLRYLHLLSCPHLFFSLCSNVRSFVLCGCIRPCVLIHSRPQSAQGKGYHGASQREGKGNQVKGLVALSLSLMPTMLCAAWSAGAERIYTHTTAVSTRVRTFDDLAMTYLILILIEDILCQPQSRNARRVKYSKRRPYS